MAVVLSPTGPTSYNPWRLEGNVVRAERSSAVHTMAVHTVKAEQSQADMEAGSANFQGFWQTDEGTDLSISSDFIQNEKHMQQRSLWNWAQKKTA